MFNLIIKVLLLTNVSHKKELLDIGLDYIDELYLPYYNIDNITESETINDIIIDIFLILTNLEQAVSFMKNKNLQKVLNILKEKLHENENLRDRLFVITNYLI